MCVCCVLHCECCTLAPLSSLHFQGKKIPKTTYVSSDSEDEVPLKRLQVQPKSEVAAELKIISEVEEPSEVLVSGQENSDKVPSST